MQKFLSTAAAYFFKPGKRQFGLGEAVTTTSYVTAMNILFNLTRDLKSVQCSFIQNKKKSAFRQEHVLRS